MSCSQRTLQFFCHHLHFYLYYSNTQTLSGADNLPNSDGLVHMWGKGTVLAPNSFNSWRYLLVLVQLKVNKEITQKGCMSQSVLTKKRRVGHVMIHEGQTPLPWLLSLYCTRLHWNFCGKFKKWVMRSIWMMHTQLKCGYTVLHLSGKKSGTTLKNWKHFIKLHNWFEC